jgi:hypothetical protein
VTVSTHSSVNQAVTTTAAMWFVLRTALLAAGWTQEGSGDASTFSNAGTGPVTTAAALNATGAWIRLRDPSGNREMIIQRGASANVWSLFYSYSARFTGGSPSATVRPTATDEQTIINGSTFGSTAVGYAHAVVEDTAINGVWGWWLIRTVQSTSVRSDFVACDPLSDTTDEQRFDVLGAAIDPCVWLAFPNTATPSLSATGLTVTMQQLWYPGTVNAALFQVLVARSVDYTGGGNALADGTSAPAGLPVSPYGGGDELVAATWYRWTIISSSIPGVMLGSSHHLSLKCVAARQYPDVVQHGSLDLAWVYYNTIAIPWPKGTAPSA